MPLKAKLITFIFLLMSVLQARQAGVPSPLLERAEARLAVSSAEAMQIADSALAISRTWADERAQARSLLIISKAHHQMGIYDKAIQRALEALRIFERLRDYRYLADTYEQLGSTYWRLQNPAKVKEYYQASLELRRSHGTAEELADALNSSGIVSLHFLDQPQQALSFFNEALALSRKANHRIGIAHSLNNLGNHSLLSGDLGKALAYNQASMAIYEELGDKNRVAINLLIIGYINQLEGRAQLAESQYLEVVRRAEESLAMAVKRDALLNLSSLYEEEGKELLHLKYYKAYADLADSLSSSETASNIANLQTQFAIEKKELENAVLSLHIRQGRIILIGLSAFLALILGATLLIVREKRKSDSLLLNILPKKVADDLKHTGKSEADIFPAVSVLFSDIVGFTSLSSNLDPQVLINELSEIFTIFDRLAEENGCERIKTIGDAYLAVCGLPVARDDHAERMLRLAKGMIQSLKERNAVAEHRWEIRIGLHTGELVGGIVGIKKYIYDVFGDTVNTASRMESMSLAMQINVSGDFYQLTKDLCAYIERGEIEIKGKGRMPMYFVDSAE